MPRPAPPPRSAASRAAQFARRRPREAVASLGAVALVALLGLALGPGCAGAVRCDAMTCAPACPRDAVRDASGRCACADGTLPLLGACVPPAVGDAYCGPAAMLEAGGCVFRACTSGERLNVATGGCVSALSVVRADSGACGDAGVALLQAGRLACVPPDATCPRGARRSGEAAACERPPACPPGSLSDGDGCRPIVTLGGRYGDRRVDVGTWAARVLGFDGGSGSRELCQPLQQNSASLSLPPGTEVQVAVSLAVPDQDISRLRADVVVETTEGRGGPGRPAAPELQRLVSADVGTLLEALRGLGGEATAAAVDVRVRCALEPAAVPPPSP